MRSFFIDIPEVEGGSRCTGRSLWRHPAPSLGTKGLISADLRTEPAIVLSRKRSATTRSATVADHSKNSFCTISRSVEKKAEKTSSHQDFEHYSPAPLAFPLPCSKGHLEYFICNQDDLADGEDSVVTQECFNRYPLTRAPDDTGASPIDPNHPGRYFLDPPCRAAETDQNMADGANAGYLVTGRYVLPAGLSCERCTLQMIYCEWPLCVSSFLR